ncbi:hypothetical protein BN2475_50002 [Paraburkholderia ribeironis]|uniref:Uncharacterized protein n=1 Tax=Paraburkholderia ribeironis TaxID=1247936 RepID=A0A1N7RJV5_9BURK|nr:hypothetical protein BN2475_50002 [Paraburkholderia ribeironis]
MRIGRCWKLPPQFGHTLRNLLSAQTSQKVHSYVQIIASDAFGGSDLPHPSQVGLSSSMTVAPLFRRRGVRLACRQV